MADKTGRSPYDTSVVLRYRDMGDGTHAPVVASLPVSNAPLNSASGNVANGNAVATLAAGAGKTTYIASFEVTGAGSTAGGVVLVTVTGTLGGTLTYVLAIPAGATLGITPLIVSFATPLPASAVNTAIVVTAAAFGAGNTNAAACAHGFQI